LADSPRLGSMTAKLPARGGSADASAVIKQSSTPLNYARGKASLVVATRRTTLRVLCMGKPTRPRPIVRGRKCASDVITRTRRNTNGTARGASLYPTDGLSLRTSAPIWASAPMERRLIGKTRGKATRKITAGGQQPKSKRRRIAGALNWGKFRGTKGHQNDHERIVGGEFHVQLRHG